MNGPRLQLNMIDGYQQATLYGRDGARGVQSSYRPTNVTGTTISIWPFFSDMYLSTSIDGKQRIHIHGWPIDTMDYERHALACRYALKTTTPDVYLVVSIYRMSCAIINYAYVGQGRLETSLSAKTITVKMNYQDDWASAYNATSAPPVRGRSSSNLTGGKVSYIWRSAANNTADGHNNTNCYLTTEVDTATQTATFKFEFPADVYSIKAYGDSRLWPYVKRDMGGKIYGNIQDNLTPDISNTNYYVAKVYSPIKGCLCLKSYLNGEIPILNE